MANYFARKAGNIDATDVWATTPSGTAGAQTFVSGDVLYANSFAITVNVSTNLGSTGEVRNDNTNSATAGGGFTLSNGVTLTANVIAGSTTTACVTYAGTSGNSATIVGNCTAGSATTARAVTNTSTGTLNITGNCNGGTGSGSGTGSTVAGVVNTSSGTVNVTGNCTGGSGIWAHGAHNNSTGTINITGNCTGGPNANNSNGAYNASTGIMSITGNAFCNSSENSAGALNASTGQMSINGSIYASEFGSGVGGGVRGQVTRLTGPFYTSPTFGVNPNTCLAWRWAATLNADTFIEVPTTNLTSTRNLVTPDNATNFPAASDVRSGVTYGISGALTGTCAVPPAASVAIGVPVDNTTGSATLSPADFWGYSATTASSVTGSLGAKLAKAVTAVDIIALS